MAQFVEEIPIQPALKGFEDLAPIPQDDGPNPVVAINYTDEFRQLMDVFRAILAVDEMSERALALTSEVIEINPANYTAWHFRRRCLEALGSDLYSELRFIEEKAYDNPKNYQIWFHRRAIVERLDDPNAEIQFIRNVLIDDAKNYHAWSHRQWVLKTYNLWEGELAAIHAILTVDLRNNSAWNQRWFVLTRDGPITDADVIRREVNYALDWIDKAIDNESPWNYIRGLMRYKDPQIGDYGWRFDVCPEVKERCLALKNTRAGSECRPLLSLLLEIMENGLRVNPQDSESLTEARGIVSSLITLDAVRRQYWEERQSRLEAGVEQ